MNQYDSNVRKLMDFLIESGCNDYTLWIHRRCFQEFREYLSTVGGGYSKAKGEQWQTLNQNAWREWKKQGYRNCMIRLERLYSENRLLRYVRIYRDERCLELNDEYRTIISEYVQSLPTDSGKYRTDVKHMCTYFLLYLQKQGVSSIRDLDHGTVRAYLELETSMKGSTFSLYVNQARCLLVYLANSGHVKRGLSIYLASFPETHYVELGGMDETDRELLRGCKGAFDNGLWECLDSFINGMDSIGYSVTCKSSARRFLVLYITFLEKYETECCETTLQVWLKYETDSLGPSWKGARRAVYQFYEFYRTHVLRVDCFYYGKRKIDYLPDWCKNRINEFLEQKKRESMMKSTLDMYRSSSVRFCEYLLSQGIHGFSEVTAELLASFSRQDMHKSIEGKNAYNVRIRRFLIYLEETGTVSNPFLHKALPCVFAARDVIVKVLDPNEMEMIDSFHSNAQSPYELRADAMLQLGLWMGLRESDIVSLRFENVDWDRRTIRLVQQKTKTEVVLPMPSRVGNALFKYITQGRPQANTRYVFIHHRAPYGKLNRRACNGAIRKALNVRSGKGFHVTRKTFATGMLNAGNDPAVISDSLGHKSDGSMDVYLNLDEKRMCMCPLSFPDAGIGGDFPC